MNILQTGNLRPEDEWICSAEMDYGNPAHGVGSNPSVQTRTCLWNALARVCQYCDDNDGSLGIFATVTLVWIIEWATVQNYTSENNIVHHPMCSAAAMQVVFAVITRSKSMDSLWRDGNSGNYVRHLYRWALRELQNSLSEPGKEIRHMLSMAALKLILALLTLMSMIPDKGSETSFCLDLEEVNDTIAILQQKLKINVEDDVRRLSNKILSVLQLKN